MFSTKEPILQIFDQIERNDHVERILFYEENTELIFTLEERKQHYFTFHYIRSLFELGKYEHVISEIDPIIEYVFLYNVNFLPTRTFEDLLLKKAYSLYQLVKYDEAIVLGEQLVGIHPEDLRFQEFLEKSYRSQLNFKSTGIRLTALILIFFSAIVSAILWLIYARGEDTSLIQSFFVIISPCMLALSILGGAHFYNYLKSIRMTAELVAQKIRKRG